MRERMRITLKRNRELEDDNTKLRAERDELKKYKEDLEKA